MLNSACSHTMWLEAKTHYLPLPGLGIRIRVTEIGSGKPILVVPGNTGEVFPLAPLIAELCDRRILAINRPGGGASEGIDHRTVDFRQLAVHTLTTVLDAFSLERAPIVAHSIGGHWSLWFALDRPQRVSALALLGVPGNLIGTRPPFALRLLSVPALNRLLYGIIFAGKPGRALKGLSFAGHSSETLAHLPQAMADCYYEFQRLPHARTASLSLMEQSNALWRSRPQIRLTAQQLQRVQPPALLLWGTHDPFGSIATGRQIAILLPSAEFHAIQGGGHLPWLDDPSGCARLAREFLAEY